jgi:hypothetical protein
MVPSAAADSRSGYKGAISPAASSFFSVHSGSHSRSLDSALGPLPTHSFYPQPVLERWDPLQCVYEYERTCATMFDPRWRFAFRLAEDDVGVEKSHPLDSVRKGEAEGSLGVLSGGPMRSGPGGFTAELLD